MFYKVHNRTPKSRPRLLLGCPGLRLSLFASMGNSGCSLGHTLHCSHPNPVSPGREQARHNHLQKDITFYLDCYLRRECFHAHDIYITGISYIGKKQTNPGIPLPPPSPHSVFPSPKCRERPVLKAQVFVPKAARSRPGHKADRLLQTLSSQRNETIQAGPSS